MSRFGSGEPPGAAPTPSRRSAAASPARFPAGGRRSLYYAPSCRLLAAAADGAGPLAAAREFKEMVRTLHGAGIEVIVDVVYNHTVEGGWLPGGGQGESGWVCMWGWGVGNGVGWGPRARAGGVGDGCGG
jgi:hypothetical protein